MNKYFSTAAASATLALAGLAPLAASADDLPLYPGATKVPHQVSVPVTNCGHKILVVDYDTNDSPDKVADWYKARIPGAMTIRHNSDPDQTSIEVIDQDGARAAVAERMHFANAKLQASAASIGMDKTTVGLERFDPPLGHAYLELMQQGESNPAAANAARAKLTAMCPKD
jgi:hypothetical protein